MKSRRGREALVPAHPEQAEAFHHLWQVIGGRRDEARIAVNEHTKPVIEGFLRFLDHRMRKLGESPKGRKRLSGLSMSTSSTSMLPGPPSAADTRKRAPMSPAVGS